MLRPGRIELHEKNYSRLPDESARRCIFSDAIRNMLPNNCGVLDNETLLDDLLRVISGQPAAFIYGLVSESAFCVLQEDELLSDGGKNLGNAAESLNHTCSHHIGIELKNC